MESVVVSDPPWGTLSEDVWTCILSHVHPLDASRLLRGWRSGEFVGGFVPVKGLRLILADPFSLLAISEDELDEPVELAREHPFPLTRWLLLADLYLGEYTMTHVTFVAELMFNRYFLIPSLANAGLAAERRIGRRLSDRWCVAAAYALCQDVGSMCARAMGASCGSEGARVVCMRLCRKLRERERQWEDVYLQSDKVMFDVFAFEAHAQFWGGRLLQFSAVVRERALSWSLYYN
jgi:hypothetical protein